MNKQKIFNKKNVCWLMFILYSILNLILMLRHEPWRDEIHAWLMAKELSIPELIVESRFDGHPILWHLLLMPFAKLGFPIITLNIIGYVIVLISVWFFLFKTDLPLLFKAIVSFTIPFTYTFSAISRNYSLIILLFMLITTLYNKRNEKPILYSILIALLVHTHSLAWGLVAGLTITFHFYEIILYFKHKNNVSMKKIILGLGIIAISTILVVLELYGTSNTDYGVGNNPFITYCIKIMLGMLIVPLLFSIINKSNYKEFLIFFCGFAFQILIYTCVYSSILFQRFILIFVFMFFYILLLSKTNIAKYKLNIICTIYLLFICIFASERFITTAINDIKYPYSAAQEMASYINENLPENSTVLVDSAVIGQALIPYLDNAKLYDIVNKSYIDCANVSDDKSKIIDALNNLDPSYSGHYIIICNNFVNLNLDVIYSAQLAIVNEFFTMYYIP